MTDHLDRMRSITLRVALWTGLVAACALPLAIAIRDEVGRGRDGVFVGVVAWVAALVWIDERRRRAGRDQRSLARMAGVYAVVQGATAAVVPSQMILVLYLPAAALSGRLILRYIGPFDTISAFVPTCACGLQVLGSLLLFERLARRFSGR